MALRAEQRRQSAYHGPRINQMLQHIQAQDGIDRAGRDLAIESKPLKVPAPYLVKDLACLGSGIRNKFDPAGPGKIGAVFADKGRGHALAAANVQHPLQPGGKVGQDLASDAPEIIAHVLIPRPRASLGLQPQAASPCRTANNPCAMPVQRQSGQGARCATEGKHQPRRNLAAKMLRQLGQPGLKNP